MKFISAHPRHAPLWKEWRTESVAVEYNPLDTGGVSLEERISLTAGNFSKLDQSSEHRWFVEIDGNTVATVALDSLNHRMRSASFGYHVGEEFSGKGLATRIVKEFIQRVFAETPLERIIATVHHEHTASMRVLEKNGFHREGRLREYLIMNERRVDFFLYSLLKSDRLSP